MENIFYFIAQPIARYELETSIAAMGYETASFITADLGGLTSAGAREPFETFNTYLPMDPNVFWSWYHTDTLNAHSEAAYPTLTKYGYATEYTISLRNDPRSINPLRDLLRLLLQDYGGWIGLDTETLEPIYHLESLDQFTFPLYANVPDLHR